MVGGGIAGIACAGALAEAGLAVTVLDRGHRIGGRLATQTLRGTGTPWDGRVVDVGASYLTVDDEGFRGVVDDWVEREVARPWTNVFHVADPEGIIGVKAGPMRYAAPRGMRSLVEDLAEALPGDVVEMRHPVDVHSVTPSERGVEVDGEEYAAVAICAPDPQASRLLVGDDPASRAARETVAAAPVWEPVLALTAVYDDHCWAPMDGAFVNDDPVLTWIADDGRRRGDDAPVLVAHADPVLAAGHLAEPLTAAPHLLAALQRVLRTTGDPAWFTVKRWTYARPLTSRPETHHWAGGIGLAGDAWAGGPRTQSAWVSGRALGAAMAADLA